MSSGAGGGGGGYTSNVNVSLSRDFQALERKFQGTLGPDVTATQMQGKFRADALVSLLSHKDALDVYAAGSECTSVARARVELLAKLAEASGAAATAENDSSARASRKRKR